MLRPKIIIVSIVLLAILLPAVTFASIDVYFSLVDDPEGAIIEQLSQAQESINIAMYYFTDRDLANAVIDAHNRGVKVRVYLDKDQREAKYSKSRYLAKHNIPTRYSDNPYIMHHKFCVIDEKVVITGSYNWTASAGERNNENLLIIYNKEVAREYLGEFNRLWNEHWQFREGKTKEEVLAKGLSVAEVLAERKLFEGETVSVCGMATVRKKHLELYGTPGEYRKLKGELIYVFPKNPQELQDINWGEWIKAEGTFNIGKEGEPGLDTEWWESFDRIMQAKISRNIPKTDHKENNIRYSLIDFGIGKVKLRDKKTGEVSLSQRDCFWAKVKIANISQHKIVYASLPSLNLIDNYGNEYAKFHPPYSLEVVGPKIGLGKKLKPGKTTIGLLVWSAKDFVEDIKFLKMFGGWPRENFFTVLLPISRENRTLPKN